MLGDPGVPSSARKGSPLKDIAAMLSSFEAAAAEGAIRSRHLIGSQGWAHALSVLERYVRESQGAFLHGYRQIPDLAEMGDLDHLVRPFRIRSLAGALADNLDEGGSLEAYVLSRLISLAEAPVEMAVAGNR